MRLKYLHILQNNLVQNKIQFHHINSEDRLVMFDKPESDVENNTDIT